MLEVLESAQLLEGRYSLRLVIQEDSGHTHVIHAHLPGSSGKGQYDPGALDKFRL